MQRFLVPAFAAVAIAGVAWLAPQPAAAQNPGQTRSYNQNGATAWGDPWLNENDFDYNRRHWLPSDNNRRNQSYNNWNSDQSQGGYGQNNWNGNQGYNQNWDGNRRYQGYGQYQNNYGPNQGYYPNQGNYGQNDRNWNGPGYDNRYGSAYPGPYNDRGGYNGQPGYGRNAPPPPYAGPSYDDEE